MTDYMIRETRTFYGPKTARDFVAENGEPLRFSSRLDAIAWIDQRDHEVYHLSHNECQRPDYTVLRTPSRRAGDA